MKAYHIGVDMHKRNSQIGVIDGKGRKLETRKLSNDPEALRDYLSAFPKGTPVTLEATTGYEWMCDLLTEMEFQVLLANPRKVRLIAESTIKTDTIDAWTLAQLERVNFLPTAYLPPEEIRATRELLRHRLTLVCFRKGVKNRIHAVLTKRGVLSYPVKDLFGKAGREFLSSLDLPPVYRMEVDSYLALIDQINVFIAQRERDIKKQVTQENPDAQLLMTIPGIASFSALLLVSEIGTISRFATVRKLISYAGLTSTLRESSNISHQGHLKKDSNKYIRWILIEAVTTAIKHDPGLYAFYRKILVRKGKLKARVAVAHKLLIAIYFMLKQQKPYHPKSLYGKSSRVSPYSLSGHRSSGRPLE